MTSYEPPASASAAPSEGNANARMEEYDHLVKLLLIGDSGVGKTSLLVQEVDGTFSAGTMTTIGMDFRLKLLHRGSKKVKLNIWDTAGQEQYQTITPQFYRRSRGVMLVYDVSDQKSFERVMHWGDQALQHCDPGVALILIGNKAEAEREDQRVVSLADGQALADKHSMLFMETSAKTGRNVAEAFDALTDVVVERIESEMRMSDIRLTESRGERASFPLEEQPSRPWFCPCWKRRR
eukprot:TRINITY_DN2897_c0_g1_i1.p1 TRINITY_DN2897_c0_g1~~TRINITY_DN2897_c0_g1_i1.p1  ORF type:complete len:237 (+),score=38.40 TRINITY_DN2897_c0_g1_i1:207-917(+)